MTDRRDRYRSTANGHSRSARLTDKGLAAIGAAETVHVPLLDLPWRDDARDRKDHR